MEWYGTSEALVVTILAIIKKWFTLYEEARRTSGTVDTTEAEKLLER